MQDDGVLKPALHARTLGVPKSALALAHDLVIAGFSFFLAFLLRSGTDLSPANQSALLHGAPVFLIVAGASFYAFEVHRGVWSYVSIADLTAMVKAATCAILFFLFIVFVVDRLEGVPRSVPLIQWFVLVVLLSASRLGYGFIKARLFQGQAPANNTPETPALLYGCGPAASLLIHAVRSTPGVGLRIVGVIDDVGGFCGRYVGGIPVVGRADELRAVLARLSLHGVYPQRLVITRAVDDLTERERAAVADASVRHALEIEYLPRLFGLREPGAVAGADVAGNEQARLYFRLRRVVEVVLSAAAMLALLPLLAAVAATVLLDGGRPILFRQVRPGRHLRPFTLYKFRTMRIAFAPDGTPVADDARTSAIGRFLRRTRLDELPQLYNVLVGDMAFLGPRPLLPRDLPERVTERVVIRPGITGWAQVNGGHRLTSAEKMALDAWYVRHANFVLDVRIVGLTLKMMLFGERINHSEIERAMAAA